MACSAVCAAMLCDALRHRAAVCLALHWSGGLHVFLLRENEPNIYKVRQVQRFQPHLPCAVPQLAVLR